MADEEALYPQADEVLRSKNGRHYYTVVKQLGKGGYGAVYEVKHAPHPVTGRMRISRQLLDAYAMKVELHRGKTKSLQMELEVLEKVRESGAVNIHFCRVYDTGTTSYYSFVVMTAVGQNLWHLRQASQGHRFSVYTAMGVGRQCLRAIQQMHQISYIHRDIKPGNFAAGREADGNQRLIYLLDFGMARRYKHEDGRLKRPRLRIGFRGTVRYASVVSHEGRDLARRDDLESWFYALLEMTAGSVPWGRIQSRERERVHAMKLNCRMGAGREELLANTPRSTFDHLLDYIDKLEFQKIPDYDYMEKLLIRAQYGRNKKDIEDEKKLYEPYDWEDNAQRHIGPLPPPVYLINVDRVDSP